MLGCIPAEQENEIATNAAKAADDILNWANPGVEKNCDSIEWDALGRYLQTMVFRISAGKEEYKETAQSLVTYLMTHAKQGHPDRVGWGLRQEWDSNSDGSLNAVNTIYTYTSCWIGLALLDARKIGVKGDYDILEDLVVTLQTHIPSWTSDDGTMMAIRYSDNPNDWMYRVQNVTAYTYLFLVRMAVEWPKPELLKTAQKYFAYQKTMQREDNNWSYYDPVAKPPQEISFSSDDLNHWAMEGVALYGAYQAIPDAEVKAVGRRCAEALRKTHFHLPDGRLFSDNSSIGWGVAEALNLFALVRAVDGDDWIIDLWPALRKNYLLSDGRWIDHPDNHQTQSWYACAFARLAKDYK